jgi:NAD+ kinase
MLQTGGSSAYHSAMSLHFSHVGLIGRYHRGDVNNPVGEAVREIALWLQARGARVSLDTDTALHCKVQGAAALALPDIGSACDLALVVGGDGTMLGVGRQLARYPVPMMGINHGRLGFMTDVPLNAYQPALEAVLAGEFDEDHRAVISAEVWRGDELLFKADAMNDVVVNRGPTSGMVELRVAVDGRFVANQRADGLIVATPTGSTAYALSAGGPILHPSLGAWLMVPIAPHTLSNRPIAVPDSGTVAIEIVVGRDASANFDMQSVAALSIGDRVVMKKAPYAARFLHPKGWSYYDTLRRKLHWNEGNMSNAGYNEGNA